jgi:antitoxin (DNA-binding transcriptional repressor) of toxin-antitoxin stability system
MTTLSPTKARSNLTAWLKKAAAGEDIGILFGDKVIALRPVEVESTDYAEKEYGVTKEELKRATDYLHAQGKKHRKAGHYKVYNGDIEALLKD